ncbi:uncharacterized protein LOC109861181 [Pseudomyrmex gracilis]|uniref:uncharacterized protein LOC109861181 n=1 Tax=Pseudomyrmex gracilis TaxID=219809 RepID=UPI00099548B7|nr:uncharacterized protein LOC109861181 [Pseudomyrmex gracilis]
MGLPRHRQEQEKDTNRNSETAAHVGRNVNETLDKLHSNPAHYAGYSSSGNLSRAAKPNYSRKDVVCWLCSQDAYTLHRPVQQKFPRLHYNVTNVDDHWEADLIELRNLRSYNDGYCYLLTVIDVLSKFAWVELLRDKTTAQVLRAFQRMLSRSGRQRPVYLQTDKGKKFIAHPLQKFLKEKGICFRVARNPDVKAAVIERFNRTLKERMWRYFTHKNMKRYLDVLQDIVHAYNHTPHSSIRMKPADVTVENANIARKNTWHRWKKQQAKAAKYSVDDLVRVSRAKAAFEKRYKAKWSEEIFRIHRVLEWRDPRVYELSDLADEVIDGIFYEQELAPVVKNLQEETFIVDRVIKSKGRGRNRQLLVSWQGYPSKFDSWIPASRLTTLAQGDDNDGDNDDDNGETFFRSSPEQ